MRLAETQFDTVYVSDLKRTVDTAEIIMECQTKGDRQPRIVMEPRLREKSCGVFEGQPLGSTSAMARELDINPREFKPEGGESWNDVGDRVRAFFKDLIEVHLNGKAKDESPRVLCISHGGLITEILNVL